MQPHRTLTVVVFTHCNLYQVGALLIIEPNETAACYSHNIILYYAHARVLIILYDMARF